MTAIETVIGLDVGSVRTGVAVGNSVARIARPLATLDTNNFATQFAVIVAQEKPTVVVVGLPRNLSGDATAQTAFVQEFVREHLAGQTIVWQDEAVTSQQAEAELTKRGKPFSKGDIDALAASYILQDYLDTMPVHSEVAA
jgi:putative Holliday junction resolvase